MSAISKNYDVIIIGAGAAGLMCAIKAAQRGKKTLLIEHTKRCGKKILMSGGGGCNFTNLYASHHDYISQNPHFCKSALSQYTQWDFIDLVEKHKVDYHEKTLGQLFCNNSAKDILNLLLLELEQARAKLITHCEVAQVLLLANGNDFQLITSQGDFVCGALVIATGGLSIPSMGATGFAYQMAKQFDIPVLPVKAGLVPFTFSGHLHEVFARLSGVSVAAQLSNERARFSENILFTHRGLSGPAVLQLSSYWLEREEFKVDLFRDLDLIHLFLKIKRCFPQQKLQKLLNTYLPTRLVDELIFLFWPELTQSTMQSISNKKLQCIASTLHAWPLKPSGTEGYRTAEVTLGGVDTDFISSKTMQSKTQTNLFFIGEALDVTGHLGGFNFQWAWSSAYTAAQSL